jgi:tetratricopeptide (TPR) repeat protein
LNHLIESSVFPLELVFEHRNYIPSMFVFLPPAIGIIRLLEISASQRVLRTVVSALAAIVVISFSYSTFERNFAWKSEKSLWLDAVKKSPDQFRAHHNLGCAYEREGLLKEALAQFQEALASPVIHQKNEKIIGYNQLGKVYEKLREPDRAKDCYERAVQMDPRFSEPLKNLALLYGKEGNSEKADYYLMKAIVVAPEDPLINLNMGLYWLRKGSVDSAVDHLMIAMTEKALKPEALYRLGLVCKHRGWLGRAAMCFQEVIALNPKDLRPRLHLIEILAITGHKTLAKQKAAQVVRIIDQDERLHVQVLDLIANKGHSSDVALSGDILLPLLRSNEHDLFSNLKE